MRKVLTVAALATGLTMGAANAQGFDVSNVYAGGGLGYNSVSGFDSAIGFQFFGGYKLDMVDLGPVGLSAEVGYMTTGDLDYSECYNWFGTNVCDSYSTSAKGIWSTAVFDYPVTPELTALGRVGLDFGDDDGLMFGAGIGYTVMPEIEVRGEYVIRDNVNSLQVNAVYYFQ